MLLLLFCLDGVILHLLLLLFMLLGVLCVRVRCVRIIFRSEATDFIGINESFERALSNNFSSFIKFTILKFYCHNIAQEGGSQLGLEPPFSADPEKCSI